jgi:hypothetical protein
VRSIANVVAGWLFLLAALAGTAGVAQAAASVAITINPTTLNWATVNDFTNQFLASDNGPILVTGTLVTGTTFGTHTSTIGVTAPANVLGSVLGNVVPITAFSMTCSGAGNSVAPVYAAAHTTLVASSTKTCATWSTARNTTITLNFSIAIFLDDRTFPGDTYSAAGFAVVGTAV